MNYSTDSYAAMLLCLALSANREEYAHPLSTSEYREVCRRVKTSSARHIGGLMGVDISGLMQLLEMSEEEAYRIYTLMSRSVQLSYTMDGFTALGIRIITEFDEGYPERLSKRAGDDAPPVIYVYGSSETLNMPSIGILGMSGIKTSAEVRASIEAIASFAKSAGYRVMAGGELGVSRVAANMVTHNGGRSIRLYRPSRDTQAVQRRPAVRSLAGASGGPVHRAPRHRAQ